jgi:hypothetical protein
MGASSGSSWKKAAILEKGLAIQFPIALNGFVILPQNFFNPSTIFDILLVLIPLPNDR